MLCILTSFGVLCSPWTWWIIFWVIYNLYYWFYMLFSNCSSENRKRSKNDKIGTPPQGVACIWVLTSFNNQWKTCKIHKKVKNDQKKYFVQLLGARRTQKLVEIHNNINFNLKEKWQLLVKYIFQENNLFEICYPKALQITMCVMNRVGRLSLTGCQRVA